MTDIYQALTPADRLLALRGEGSMLRDRLQELKKNENDAWTKLRDTLQELESVRFRLEHVNAEIAKCSLVI